MKKRNPNRIHELRGRRNWSQPELAEKVGAHWVTISKLERGQMQLTQEWMGRLAEALGVEPVELISDSPLVRTIYMAGIIQDAGGVESYDADKDASAEDTTVPFDVQIGAVEPDRTSWYFVNTDAYLPYFQSGDIIRFTSQTIRDIDSCIGRLCLIEVSFPAKRRIVGVVARGAEAGTLDLHVPGRSIVRGLHPEVISVASMALFNPQFVVDEKGYPQP